MAMAAAVRADVRAAARWWWVFIVTGVIWLMVSLVVLRFTETSITTIGIIIGVVFTIAAITEFMIMGATSGGWRFVHAILGVLFVLGAIWGYSNPKNAYWALAEVLGFLLVIWGAVEITEAVVTRAVNPLWWLGLVVGILIDGFFGFAANDSCWLGMGDAAYQAGGSASAARQKFCPRLRRFLGGTRSARNAAGGAVASSRFARATAPGAKAPSKTDAGAARALRSSRAGRSPDRISAARH